MILGTSIITDEVLVGCLWYLPRIVTVLSKINSSTVPMVKLSKDMHLLTVIA